MSPFDVELTNWNSEEAADKQVVPRPATGAKFTLDGCAPGQGNGGTALDEASGSAPLMGGAAFLHALWPDQGHGFYCLALLHRDRIKNTTWWKHRVFDTIAAADAAAKLLASDPTVEVFWCIHTLREREVWDKKKSKFVIRVQTNMSWACCLFFDLDVEPDNPKKYPTREEALAAFDEFVAATGMPRPMVVSSGGGWHIYWPFATPLLTPDWLVLAHKLKALAAARKLRVDTSRLIDQSSVLRVPGTTHRKDPEDPRPVVVHEVGQPTAATEIAALLDAALAACTSAGVEQRDRLAAAQGAGMFDLTEATVEAKGARSNHYSTFPTTAELGKACAHFRWAAVHQDKVAEPLWFHLLNLSRFLAEGRMAAHAISRNSKKYTVADTEAKLDQLEAALDGKLGPTRCTTMADHFGPERCEACWYKGNAISSPIVAARKLAAGHAGSDDAGGIVLTDLWALADMHRFMCLLTGKTWPAQGVDGRFRPIEFGINPEGKKVVLKATQWLYQHQAADGLTWWPGKPQVILDYIAVEGTLVEMKGAKVLNLYRPSPTLQNGNPGKAGPWIDHVRATFPDDADHIIAFLAHRYQRPEEKINHALVLGGKQGIGKDTILSPVQQALGLWNCKEIKPLDLIGRFTSFYQSTLLIISEVHDTGDMGRYQFYECSKTALASPPEYLRVEEKFVPAYLVPNCCGVMMTTNHKVNGIYLPPDDRRHYVAWSPREPGDVTPEQFDALHAWFAHEGNAHVQAYLATYDLSSFNAKAPPPKTQAWREIVSAGRAPEEAELADVIDKMGGPDALTIRQLLAATSGAIDGIGMWLREPKNRRPLQGRLERAGYVAVSNNDAKDGMWKVGGARAVIYANAELPERDRQQAARTLVSAASRSV